MDDKESDTLVPESPHPYKKKAKVVDTRMIITMIDFWKKIVMRSAEMQIRDQYTYIFDNDTNLQHVPCLLSNYLWVAFPQVHLH